MVDYNIIMKVKKTLEENIEFHYHKNKQSMISDVIEALNQAVPDDKRISTRCDNITETNPMGKNSKTTKFRAPMVNITRSLAYTDYITLTVVNNITRYYDDCGIDYESKRVAFKWLDTLADLLEYCPYMVEIIILINLIKDSITDIDNDLNDTINHFVFENELYKDCDLFNCESIELIQELAYYDVV